MSKSSDIFLSRVDHEVKVSYISQLSGPIKCECRSSYYEERYLILMQGPKKP